MACGRAPSGAAGALWGRLDNGRLCAGCRALGVIDRAPAWRSCGHECRCLSLLLSVARLCGQE
eukprot:5259855-Heterocapsa_arctica.AAC.1